jgi:hypothetical protein
LRGTNGEVNIWHSRGGHGKREPGTGDREQNGRMLRGFKSEEKYVVCMGKAEQERTTLSLQEAGQRLISVREVSRTQEIRLLGEK